MANAESKREAGRQAAGSGAASTQPTRRPMTLRGEGFVVSPRRWPPWVAFTVIVIVWQLAVDLGAVDEISRRPSSAAPTARRVSTRKQAGAARG